MKAAMFYQLESKFLVVGKKIKTTFYLPLPSEITASLHHCITSALGLVGQGLKGDA